MLAIEVELLHGTFRGTGADDLTLAGIDSAPEWPPSPARLFSALVAGGGTRTARRVSGDDGELRLLERAAPPVIEADPLSSTLVGYSCDRFVVIDERDVGSFVQNYPMRAAQAVRSSPVMAPTVPIVRYVWADVNADESELRSLQERAARVGYFGCSDSPARVRVSDASQGDPDIARTWKPAQSGTVVLGVPTEGLVDRLDAAFDTFSAGVPQRRTWIGVATASYGIERPVVELAETIWLAFDEPISARFPLAVAETLRNAVLDHYERIVGSRDLVPAVIHGHSDGSENFDHMSVAALPFVGHPRADGRIRGALIMLPKRTPGAIVEHVRIAAGRIDRLVRVSKDRKPV